jgi:hypothetical protein
MFQQAPGMPGIGSSETIEEVHTQCSFRAGIGRAEVESVECREMDVGRSHSSIEARRDPKRLAEGSGKCFERAIVRLKGDLGHGGLCAS